MKRLLTFIFLVASTCYSQDVYRVELNNIKCPVQSTMWDLFFEDINRGGDGGLYAELIKNRSFDFPDAFMGWTTVKNHCPQSCFL